MTRTNKATASRSKRDTRPTGVRESVASYDSRPARDRASRRALFDVNVLIALLDADHVHHARATDWLGMNIAPGWASCAVTQNGCVRIMSQPAYPNAFPTAQVAARLQVATRTRHHLWVDADVSLLDPTRFHTDQLLGHRQVTDAWLLGLAVRHELRLVTFDGGIARRVVRSAGPEHIVAI